GGVFTLRSDGMPDAEQHLIRAVARAIISDDAGSLAERLDHEDPIPPIPVLNPWTDEPSEMGNIEVPPLLMENGCGGFTQDGREYAVVLDGDGETPLPWSNVIANPNFGTIVTATGAAHTWAENSREMRLSPFANDPVT